MSIKEVIKFNGNDVNLKFSLGQAIDLIDYQQQIDKLTEETKEELINPVIDYEVRRFKNNAGLFSLKLSFYFLNNNNFITAGFTSDEIRSNSDNMRKSFFILDFFDNFDNNTQTKIFTAYLTKILNGNELSGVKIPKYSIGAYATPNQFYYLNIPESYLDKQTGSTAIAYIRFSFYNAKTGKLSVFYNKDNQELKTPEKMYFKTTLNLIDKEWEFESTDEIAYELSPLNSYVSKVNDTYNNFNNEQQNYPEGTIFDSSDGSYFNESGE